MKSVLTLILCICISFTTVGQYFSGELEYQIHIVPKEKGFNVDSAMADQPGTSSVYRIADGYYKSTYFRDGKEVYSYTYHGDTKRMFDETEKRGVITWRDSRKANATRIRSIIYKDSIKTIAGQKCFMVERVYQKYILKMYYAQDLKINVESFKDHAKGDWYNQIKEVDGALSLSSVSEYATHYEFHDVIKVTERKLKPIDFALPESKKVAASTDALDEDAELDKPTQEVVKCYESKILMSPNVDYTCYVGFIVGADGQLSAIEPHEEDEDGLYKVAIDIVTHCGLQFRPGTIDGKPVDSWVYFPVKFAR